MTDASTGFIYSDILNWNNYKLSFDFQIANWGTNDDGGLGIIIRANDLAQYGMLQIKRSGIGPHLYINGGWKVWQPKDVNMVFDEPVKVDSWYKCEISCDKSTVNIKIFLKRRRIFDRIWVIPAGVFMFKFDYKDENNKDQSSYMPFSLTPEYGSIGFRAWGPEKAFIKNVVVKKI
nr:family 16 glycoside hydrolase [Niastella populi]